MAEDIKQSVEQALEDPRRSFLFENPDTGEVEEYFIGDPTASDIRKADWQYSKVFNQALADGFPTTSEMIDILRKRGILGEEFDKQMEEVRVGLAAALFRLENLGDDASDEDRERAALEVAEFRQRLFRLNQKVNGPMGNTCENLAEDARNEYLTSRLVQRKDGSRVWETYEDYLNEPNSALTVKARFEVMLWLQGLDPDFMDNTPEQQVLRDLAQRRIQALATSEEGEAVDKVLEEETEEAIHSSLEQVASSDSEDEEGSSVESAEVDQDSKEKTPAARASTVKKAIKKKSTKKKVTRKKAPTKKQPE